MKYTLKNVTATIASSLLLGHHVIRIILLFHVSGESAQTRAVHKETSRQESVQLQGAGLPVQHEPGQGLPGTPRDVARADGGSGVLLRGRTLPRRRGSETCRRTDLIVAQNVSDNC